MKLASTVALALLVSSSGCFSTGYLAEQGVGQLELLHRRRRISDVLDDPSVAPALKDKLRLALAARHFGVSVLGLSGGAAFTRYLDTGGAPVAWNVTAAPPDRLQPYLWHFPIVGAIPYLGYFHERDARAEAARLARQGYDVYVRPVAGYSTLGITADPVYSSMLEGDDARIVEVVLHEMTHGTVFLAGHASFNESLATFVGLQGAAAFFAARGSRAEAERLLGEAARREAQAEAFSQYLAPVVRALDSLYAEPISRAAKLRQRRRLFAQAKTEFQHRFPAPPGRPPGAFLAQPLNNAVILAFAVYHRATPMHLHLFERLDGNLPALIRLYKHAVHDEDHPLAYLRQF